MKKYFLIIAVFFISVNATALAQGGNGVIGKFFSKSDVQRIFGPYSYKFSLPASALREHCRKAGQLIGFQVSKGRIRIVNTNRLPVYPEGTVVQPGESFYYYSTSLVEELISSNKTLGSEADIDIELREDEVVTITFGEQSLEAGMRCPPTCACPPTCPD